jgi:hypothetical protein
MRIVRVKLLHVGRRSIVRLVGRNAAVGMVLGIVRRRANVDPGITTGTLSRLLVAL